MLTAASEFWRLLKVRIILATGYLAAGTENTEKLASNLSTYISLNSETRNYKTLVLMGLNYKSLVLPA